jgi:hypothetical protein
MPRAAEIFVLTPMSLSLKARAVMETRAGKYR